MPRQNTLLTAFAAPQSTLIKKFGLFTLSITSALYIPDVNDIIASAIAAIELDPIYAANFPNTLAPALPNKFFSNFLAILSAAFCKAFTISSFLT